jgi:2,4-dienoyl-CoA reductase-like NADH-dependent reductase (Old Yellow Enzyme family)/thioredoxin reductase
MTDLDALLSPLRIKNLTIRNRVMSTGHVPGYARDGMPTERYMRYHEEKARGGIGLTVFGGSSTVSPEVPASAWNQISLADDAIIPVLREFSRRIHALGAAVMIQLDHQGRRAAWDAEHWFPPISSSPLAEPAHRHFPKEMEDWDIERVVADFGLAARRCREGGLDGCEIGVAGPHLIPQFWSPYCNKRTDAYGGSLENRLRFVFEVLAEVRRQVGDEFIVGVRMSGDELVEGGLDDKACLQIAERLAGSGLIDFLDIHGGQSYEHLTVSVGNNPNMAMPVAPYLYLASAVKAAVAIPVFHAQRIADIPTAARAIGEGHVDMVGMTRAHIADPHIVRKMMEGRTEDIRQCVGAAYCVDRLFSGRDALCLHNAATGREETMPHVIAKASVSRKIVVIGAGPAGLEAARVSAERGHSVTLFEAAERVGGQINLASAAPWRESMSGIPRWLGQQVQKLGVDLRLGVEAGAAEVLALKPEVVIVATGGRPNKGPVSGGEFAVTTWDILSRRVAPAGDVLVFDDHGQHQAASCAEFLALNGSRVEFVTPDRTAMTEVGATNYPIHLRELYKRGVIFSCDQRLISIYKEGNRLVAVLRNEYSRVEEERVIDQVVIEHGTLPRDEAYRELRSHSGNRGEIDVRALIGGREQLIGKNAAGSFQLFRIGDAVASRNIHAAIYDALRLCKDL